VIDVTWKTSSLKGKLQIFEA